MNKRALKVGALMSDLTAGFFSLVTEQEKGELFGRRRREVTATLNALLLLVQDWNEPPSTN